MLLEGKRRGKNTITVFILIITNHYILLDWTLEVT
jgi:hypothetical protein